MPEDTRDWSELEVLALVRAELGAGLRRKLQSTDVQQDVLLTVHRQKQDSPGGIEDFRAWLKGVVRNCVLNLAKFHSARRRDAAREVDEPTRLDRASGEAGPLEELIAERDYARLLRALRELDEPSRRVILLRNYEKLPWNEIAGELGKPSTDAARKAHRTSIVKLTAAFEHLPEDMEP